MQFTKSTLFRLIIILLLAGHVFYMYCTARTMRETFGAEVMTILPAAGFGLLMLIPFLWLVCVPEFPEILQRHTFGPRRARAGKCPWCGYPASQAKATTCAECGRSTAMPEPYEWRWHVVRLFLVMNIAAWIIGCAAGELLVGMDERAFVNDVEDVERDPEITGTNRRVVLFRERRWPSNATMVYTIETKQFGGDASLPSRADLLPPVEGQRMILKGI
jgi:hypothetical protein